MINSGLEGKEYLQAEQNEKASVAKTHNVSKDTTESAVFLRKASVFKVKGSLKITLGDDSGMFGCSHIVNYLYVLGREAFKDFETKTFSGIFQRVYYPYQNKLEGAQRQNT